MKFVFRFLVVISFMLLTTPTWGQAADQTQNASKMGQKGKVCAYDCHCGCHEGSPCTCASQTVPQSCPAGCGCQFDCKCGCQKGEPCKCKRTSSEGGSCLAEDENESDNDNEIGIYQTTPDSGSVPYPYDSYCCWDNDWWWLYPSNTWGVWLPEAPPLFNPFIADPRIIDYSVGWRFNDRLFHNNICPVSFGDILPIFRLYNPFGFAGVAEFDVQGGLWAIFEQTNFSAPLVNADYFIGFPLTYAYGCWSFRLRPFHISSHIGDEFLLLNPGFDRRNPSAEYLDFAVSYQATCDTRVYGLLGWVVRSDKTFRCRKLYTQWGFDMYFTEYGFCDDWNSILGRPFCALFVQQQGDHSFKLDTTVAAGYEWAKTCGLERKLRAFIEYHTGYSVEGQFCRGKTSYTTLKLSYGF